MNQSSESGQVPKVDLAGENGGSKLFRMGTSHAKDMAASTANKFRLFKGCATVRIKVRVENFMLGSRIFLLKPEAFWTYRALTA